MRLLITTHGGAGHFHPLAPIADAALEAGHDVTFAVEPPYDARIAAAGYAVHRMGMSFDLSSPEATFPDVARHSGLEGAMWMMEHVFFGALATAALPDVERLIEEWQPDVVLNETGEIAGLLAAERCGTPHATFNYGGMDLSVLRYVAGPAWDTIRDAHQLAPDPDMTVMTGAPIIAALPASWAGASASPHVQRVALPLHDAPSPEHAVERVDLADGLVYVTLGTVNRDHRTLASVVAAVGQLASPALVTTGHRLLPADLPAPPDHVQVRRYVPNSQVLPRARVVVHHGGFNTLLGALRFGLPQVLLPMDADQPLNAARAEELGLAVVLPPERREPADIAAAIRGALDDPELRSRAQQMRAEIDALEPVGAAVRALETLAHRS